MADYMIYDIERPLTQISRLCHYLMLNISETVRDTDIVTIERERERTLFATTLQNRIWTSNDLE